MIYSKTWDFLFELAEETHEYSIIPLFLYYTLRGDIGAVQTEIHKAIGLNTRTIKAGTATLCELNFITIIALKHNKKIVEVHNPPSVSLVVAIPILYQYYDIRYKEKGEDISDDQTNWFTLKDVEADEDWIKAESILKKYFKPYQYHPQHLVTKKKFFNPFIALVTDKAVDFNKYCEWYRVNKYPYKKFNYGLFLHPGVVAEYRDTLDSDEDLRYMNTSSMSESESFKQSVEDNDAFLDEIAEDMRET